MKSFFTSLKNGFLRIKGSPQLLYTLFVAIVIFIAFVVMATWFLSIAKQSQDRLASQRITALQDAFVILAEENITRPEFLQESIERITADNDSIVDFKIALFENSESLIIASSDKQEIGSIDRNEAELYRLTNIEANGSTQIPDFENGERIFNFVRAIKNSDEKVIGAILVKQTLTMGDQRLSRLINLSTFTFVLVLILIMYLFFRHSRIIDYAVLYKRLSEVDQLKDEFISMASHELRTPLTVIKGYAEFVSEAPELEPETAKNVEKISISAKQLDDLVTDMLDVSRIEQGRMELRFKDVDLRDAVDEIVDQLKVRADEKGLDLVADDIEDVSLYVDPAKFRQVLINIVGNSLKYTKEGEVRIETERKLDRLIIRISDTGIGISAEDREKLFDKFYRIRNSETAGVRGTGLGLWITKQLVELMKGKIRVESIKKVGTHFVLEFPIMKK